ncbi:mitochondrial import inner membrane translocase subunit Tim10 B [Genypterus blacodes]|uniref:mitochondrial import inner membrane translocase subunit Tim10 B n=1 Tax=Genypterus blacodes TaxID=154954 RepID=UPI003F771E51
MEPEQQQLRNLRDFLMVYNRMTETCFQKCSSNFNYRNLTMDEERCVDSCAGKLIRSNHRLMSSYVQLMPKMMQRRMDELESKAAESAKAAEAAAASEAAAAAAAAQTPVTAPPPQEEPAALPQVAPPVAPLEVSPVARLLVPPEASPVVLPVVPPAVADVGPADSLFIPAAPSFLSGVGVAVPTPEAFTPPGLDVPVHLDVAALTAASQIQLSAAAALTPATDSLAPAPSGPPYIADSLQSGSSAIGSVQSAFAPSMPEPSADVAPVSAVAPLQGPGSLGGPQGAPQVSPSGQD